MNFLIAVSNSEIFYCFSQQNDEREQKARDFMRAEMRHQRALQDLKQKQLEIQDKQKKYQEMQIKWVLTPNAQNILEIGPYNVLHHMQITNHWNIMQSVALIGSWKGTNQILKYVSIFRLKEFAKQYDVIKTERNKYVNQIQTSTQKAAEMREKIKILQNEIEIQRTALAQKER